MSETNILDSGTVEINISNSIATISFFHPNSNSLPGQLLRNLADTIESAGNNNDVKVIVLQSGGNKAFCAGASFDELAAIEEFENGKKFFMGFAYVINAIRKCPKFVICRVQGKAAGGGVGLACAADYTLAIDSASVRLSELALGIGPFVVGPAVERKIGKGAYSQMSIDFAWYAAQWAKDRSMYAEIYPDIESLDKAIAELAARLASSSAEAMADLKSVIWQGTENWDQLLESRAEISGRLVLSQFTKDYIKKFKEK